jgi:hypothetical protein
MSCLRILLIAIACEISRSIRNVRIFGNITLGYYYIEAYVGTPPQVKSLILDTGSQQTIFSCNGCVDCGRHLYGQFDISKSSSFRYIGKNETNFGWQCGNENSENHCTFLSSYLEGSLYEGVLGIDRFLFQNDLNSEDSTQKTHIFGCALKETGQFASQAVDGIIGFGTYNVRKYFEPPTLIEIELIQKRISGRVFSICLGDDGGQLTLGDWNIDRHLPDSKNYIIDASRMDWGDQYFIGLDGIKVK